jgi:hypothetical protein
MSPEAQPRSLEMRVAELEDKLARIYISEEEWRSYQKVAALMAGQLCAAPTAQQVPQQAPQQVPQQAPVGQPIVAQCIISQCIISQCIISQCIRQCIRQCIISQCIRQCIVDCTCGPCAGASSIGPSVGGGFESFGF